MKARHVQTHTDLSGSSRHPTDDRHPDRAVVAARRRRTTDYQRAQGGAIAVRAGPRGQRWPRPQPAIARRSAAAFAAADVVFEPIIGATPAVTPFVWR